MVIAWPFASFIFTKPIIPKFKAGINERTVTAAEVGSVKREITFHRDVLKTATRIQKVCNPYKNHWQPSTVTLIN